MLMAADFLQKQPTRAAGEAETIAEVGTVQPACTRQAGRLYNP
jgi:hypothetical protein